MQILNIPHACYAEHFSKFTLSLFASGTYVNSWFLTFFSMLSKTLLIPVEQSTHGFFSPRVAHLRNESAASLSSELGSNK